ncbi:polysaccharide deacetylase family protein [Massilia horti]|uniref:Polysaccharide deacetylase family protein n=1 Tax=Massilia horti TaxID=2562153 RepID=A0A4Y9T695_9BURK|nr:polysaccharide deacetylase family protein [Massilia horti]TFW34206.1 polysaccharide deacetylase family protein [Massilia horti]
MALPGARACAGLVLAASMAVAQAAAPQACRGTIYLTFDTGSQSQAELIANTLNKHHVKATFFLANEKTVRGDWSLDPSWAGYWKARVAEGHAFGSHTFDHVYWQRDLPKGAMVVKPQFGEHAGQKLTWSAGQYCDELRRVDTRFAELTGHHLDPLFRAPGGHTSPNLLAAAKSCGYAHVGWAKAGFSGDETSSEVYPNAVLLKRALDNLKDGDIFMAHMGIWSRKDPWAPSVLEPLITGLQQKGFCFATLREHPDYSSTAAK